MQSSAKKTNKFVIKCDVRKIGGDLYETSLSQNRCYEKMTANKNKKFFTWVILLFHKSYVTSNVSQEVPFKFAAFLIHTKITIHATCTFYYTF